MTRRTDLRKPIVWVFIFLITLCPLTALSQAGYTIITRDDGSNQWAYKGRPLYTWKDDKKPGDITGDGFLNGAWHIAQP
jgi:predicted lipoprotein with Yx(FWY)xxD motif